MEVIDTKIRRFMRRSRDSRAVRGRITQAEYAEAFGLSVWAVARRERLEAAPAEAMLCLQWCASHKRLPGDGELQGLDALRDGFAYRAAREALGLSQADLAGELGISVATIANRENERGAGRVGREAALSLRIVAERVKALQRLTLDAIQGGR